MSLDTKIFTRILLENQIIKNRTSHRVASRNISSQLVPYLESQMVSLSKELTNRQARLNSQLKKRKTAQPINISRKFMKSMPHMPIQQPKHTHYPSKNSQPLRLHNILDKCSRFHRPANCSLSTSQHFMDRQMHIIKRMTDMRTQFSMDDITESDIAGYEQVRQERHEREECRKFQVLTRVCQQNRKKLQKAISKREKSKTTFYTVT